jgi:hypothetical protein
MPTGPRKRGPMTGSASNYDVQLHVGESRDSPPCNCASEVWSRDRLEKAMIAGEFAPGGEPHIRRVSAGRNDMKRFYARLAIAAVAALGGWVLMAPASAAPPTVTPSPGYDARLQEQRAAQTYDEPVVRTPRPVSGRHVKRIHDGAH